MTEQVIRHRGASRNDDGEWVGGSDDPLTAMQVAPGTGSQYAERSREGESTAYTVYFPNGVDIKSSDELTVRDERFAIIVNDWRPAGLEVLCTRSQG